MMDVVRKRYELVAVPGSARDKSTPAIVAEADDKHVLIPVFFASSMHPDAVLALLHEIQEAVRAALPELFQQSKETAPAL